MSVYHPFERITNVFQYMPAIGHQSGLRSTFTGSCSLYTAAVKRDNLSFQIFSEPSSQRTLIAGGKQDEGTVSIKNDC